MSTQGILEVASPRLALGTTRWNDLQRPEEKQQLVKHWQGLSKTTSVRGPLDRMPGQAGDWQAAVVVFVLGAQSGLVCCHGMRGRSSG